MIRRIFIIFSMIIPGLPESVSESESTRRSQNRYRYRKMVFPGLGISIGIGPDMGKESASESGSKILESPTPALSVH